MEEGGGRDRRDANCREATECDSHISARLDTVVLRFELDQPQANLV